MPDLRAQLAPVLPACAVVGVGNVDYGDDAAGVRLAEALQAAGYPAVLVAGTSPEKVIGRLVREQFARALFLDAVDFGGAPGSVVLFHARELQQRFPQVSTHKISLGTVAQLLAQDGCDAWLLGIQPASLKAGELSAAVQQTVSLLRDLLVEMIPAPSGMEAVQRLEISGRTASYAPSCLAGTCQP